MRAAFLLPFLLLAGCTGDPAEDACRSIVTDSIVDEVRDGELLIDDRSLVLNVRDALVLERVDGACHPTTDVRPGDRVGHDATEIAMSYPGQAWPEHVVVEPGGP